MKRKTSNQLAKKEAVYCHLIRNHIFNDYCYDGDLDKIRKKINLYRGVLVKYLYCLREYQNIHYRDQKKWNKRYGFHKSFDDTRSGFETYGYDDLEEGSIKKDLKLSDRTYSCVNCGTEIDRDLNASTNLKQLYTASSAGINDSGDRSSAKHITCLVQPVDERVNKQKSTL